jgi:hypothetical protein
MTEEIKKRAGQGIRDFFLGGTFISCILIFWKVACFVTTVNLYMEAQKIEMIKFNVRLSEISNNLETLKQWKVATTGKPFQEKYGE